MTDISSIIERVEKATGPDRGIDRMIHFHVESPWLAEKCVKWTPAAFEGPNDFLWWPAQRLAEGKEGYLDGWENYTASVDAALVLIDVKLPGWSGVVDFGNDSPMRRADLAGARHREALQTALVAMKIASVLPGVADEYDFGDAIKAAEAALKSSGKSGDQL